MLCLISSMAAGERILGGIFDHHTMYCQETACALSSQGSAKGRCLATLGQGWAPLRSDCVDTVQINNTVSITLFVHSVKIDRVISKNRGRDFRSLRRFTLKDGDSARGAGPWQPALGNTPQDCSALGLTVCCPCDSICVGRVSGLPRIGQQPVPRSIPMLAFPSRDCLASVFDRSIPRPARAVLSHCSANHTQTWFFSISVSQASAT